MWCDVVCCRLEAASKAARLSNTVTEVSECSSLRRSTVDNDIDADCLEITLGGHHHGVDDGCCRTADWLVNVDTDADLQTTCEAPPPPILKNGVKKEVKFCLDVSDEDGLKRPLNVYQPLPETVLLRVCCNIVLIIGLLSMYATTLHCCHIIFLSTSKQLEL